MSLFFDDQESKANENVYISFSYLHTLDLTSLGIFLSQIEITYGTLR